MFSKSVARAWKDTVHGQLTALFVVVAGGAISLIFLYYTESASVAAEEIPYVYGAIAGAIGALILLFFWNLACAPYRNERDEHLATKRRLEVLEATQPSSQWYEGDHEQLMLFVVNYLLPLMNDVRDISKEIEDAPEISDNPALAEALNDLSPLTGSPVEFIPLEKMVKAVHNIEKNCANYIAEIDDAAAESNKNIYTIPKWEAWRHHHSQVVDHFERIKRNSRLGKLFRPARESRWGRLVGTAKFTRENQFLVR